MTNTFLSLLLLKVLAAVVPLVDTGVVRVCSPPHEIVTVCCWVCATKKKLGREWNHRLFCQKEVAAYRVSCGCIFFIPSVNSSAFIFDKLMERRYRLYQIMHYFVRIHVCTTSTRVPVRRFPALALFLCYDGGIIWV